MHHKIGQQKESNVTRQKKIIQILQYTVHIEEINT